MFYLTKHYLACITVYGRVQAPTTLRYVHYTRLCIRYIRTRNIYQLYYRGRLFSNAVARGGRNYGLEHTQETVDWAPRGSWGAESTLSWVCSSRFQPTELKIRVYTLYFDISAQIRKVANLVPQC